MVEIETHEFLYEVKIEARFQPDVSSTCLDNDGYETPELNNLTHLLTTVSRVFGSVLLDTHISKGFQRIEGLEPYANFKALWLESNGLTKIENLAPLTNLRCLYLSKNLIEHVENLECLNTLDLSDNRITRLSRLVHLPMLSSLIQDYGSIKNKSHLGGMQTTAS